MTLPEQLPFYRQLIAWGANGFSALDEESQSEVMHFVMEQQDSSGGFFDRARTADPYYSLFGFLLAGATGAKNAPIQLQRFVSEQQKISHHHLINRCCLALIEQESRQGAVQKFRRLTGIFRELILGSTRISLPYQFFLVFLTLDAYGLNNRVARLVVRPYFKRQALIDDVPCPVLAAMIVMKTQLGLETCSDIQRLMAHFDEARGFKAFREAPSADLLSTAVALVALHMAGADLRLVRPACLQQVEECFDSGAFLAGNGDWERDTEYTFYGLLALGLLVKRT